VTQTMPVWRVAKASSTGTSHAATRTPCQDYLLVDQVSLNASDGECLLVAMADGAGTASRSDEGAKRACDSFVRSLKESWQHLSASEPALEAVRRAFEVAKAEVASLSAECEVDIREFASTLCGVVLAPWGFICAQVGDGLVIFVPHEGAPQLACDGRGEMLNVTEFITQDDSLSRLHVHAEARIARAVVVSTDGLVPVLMRQSPFLPHVPMINMLTQAVANSAEPGELDDELKALIESEEVSRRTDDDKSLVVAVALEG
jgi:serine/threonine protein phosphatase PrpC